MDANAFKKYIKLIKIGKHLPDSVYLHKSAIKTLPDQLHDFLEKTIAEPELKAVQWNIVKLFKQEFKISLLDYPEFYTEVFPLLACSHSIEMKNFLSGVLVKKISASQSMTAYLSLPK